MGILRTVTLTYMDRAALSSLSPILEIGAADLKFLPHLRQTHLEPQSKAAVEINKAAVLLRSRSSCQRMPRCIAKFESRALVRSNALRPSHDGDQHAALEQPLRDAPGVFQSYRIDQGPAPLDIADAQAIELDLQQRPGDLVGGVEV